MQSHDCAKYLRICANFGLIDTKQEEKNPALTLCICHKLTTKNLVSHVFMSFLTHVSEPNFKLERFDCAK